MSIPWPPCPSSMMSASNQRYTPSNKVFTGSPWGVGHAKKRVAYKNGACLCFDGVCVRHFGKP